MGNHQLLLNKVIEQFAATAPENLGASELYEYFVTTQVFKDLDLSPDELIDGITDGSGDGGIDAFFAFANENLIQPDSDMSNLPKGFSLDLYFIQAKTEEAFGESALDKMKISIPELLDLTQPINATLYSPAIIERLEVVRKFLSSAAHLFPKVQVNIVYASKGSTAAINRRVLNKQTALINAIEKSFEGCTVNLEFIGAKELHELAAK